MTIYWQVFGGLLLTYILGLCVGPLVKCIQRSAPLNPLNAALKGKWQELTKGNEGGKLLGDQERLLFFSAFWMDWPAVIAAWLAFKVASKWNAWTT